MCFITINPGTLVAERVKKTIRKNKDWQFAVCSINGNILRNRLVKSLGRNVPLAHCLSEKIQVRAVLIS